MPEISRFYGIIIYMYAKDHLPPHFHAFYNDEEVMIRIDDAEVIVGSIPRKQLRLVQAWAEIHKIELFENFELLRQSHQQFKKIAPLS